MLIQTLPPQLTLALVNLAPLIAAVRSAVQLLAWSSPASALVLPAWWALCLLLDSALRRFLPFVLLALPLLLRSRPRPPPQPLTESALQHVIADLTLIHAAFSSPFPPLPPPSIPLLLRVAAILYLPYLLLSYFLSFRLIFALTGTLLLAWPAPFAVVLRATLWQSAYLRWSLYKAWAFLSGVPLPPPTFSPESPDPIDHPVQSLRFLFTIYENQRWWMGLDWTAALLPGERPSWCSASQQPISPPNAFSLPPDTTVILPDGKGGHIKRTATWKWEEPEWRVLVHKDGSNINRVEKPLPPAKDDAPTSSRLLKAAGRLRDTEKAPTDDHTADDSDHFLDEDLLTDPDGWIFADNKWEAPSNKGGMGKYTRYRRWTRIGIVFEVAELVSDQETIHKEEGSTTPTVPSTNSPPTTDHSTETVTIENPPEGNLRHRLKQKLTT